ncbi:DNA polymerase III subunit delta' [Candidatus Ecksteinia adelgidicola]|nr:DNA polymerase III subunit delta' [Candidatus Ecksteinia adelgidicola]
MNQYPWLQKSYCQIIQSYTFNKRHYALLLHGFEGNGIDVLSYLLSCWLLCKKRKEKTYCGRCHSCALMLAKNHPDYYVLKPEKNKKYLGIELIRQTIEQLYSCSQQGGAKVVLLFNAELVTDSACNALLKILEEPPNDTYFLLSCQEPLRVLATLRSRCVYWNIRNPDETYSIQWLNQNAIGNHIQQLTALRLCNGAPIAAEKFLRTKHWNQRCELFVALNVSLSQNNILSLLPFLNHENVCDRLYWLYTLFIDVIKLNLEISKIYIFNQDQQELLQQLNIYFNNNKLLNISKQLLICRYHVFNIVGINVELLLVEQLLNLEKELHVVKNVSLFS